MKPVIVLFWTEKENDHQEVDIGYWKKDEIYIY